MNDYRVTDDHGLCRKPKMVEVSAPGGVEQHDKGDRDHAAHDFAWGGRQVPSEAIECEVEDGEGPQREGSRERGPTRQRRERTENRESYFPTQRRPSAHVGSGVAGGCSQLATASPAHLSPGPGRAWHFKSVAQ